MNQRSRGRSPDRPVAGPGRSPAPTGEPRIFGSERAYVQQAWLGRQLDPRSLQEEVTPPMAALRQAQDRPRETNEGRPEPRRGAAGAADRPNPLRKGSIGRFRQPNERRLVIAEEQVLREFAERRLLPGFLEAGARERLRFDPCSVRAAIVAAGGTAPGTNAIIHAIVRRHHQYAAAARAAWQEGGHEEPEPVCTGEVLGVRNGFEGLMAPRAHPSPAAPGPVALTPDETQAWREQGGCQLGLSRYDFSVEGRIEQLAHNLMAEEINILYVIGGDGGMQAALQLHHALQQHPAGREIVIAGIPKTIDNNVPWMHSSLGHASALAEAARLLNVLRLDAEANRRVVLVELFGKDAGFVAANAALLSGKVDCVLIPEEPFDPYKAVEFIAERARQRHCALVVLAEGALMALADRLSAAQLITPRAPATLGLRDPYYDRQDLSDAALNWMRDELRSQFMQPPIFTGHIIVNRPGYLIRAVPPGAQDLMHAERMGDLAVDGALAGYTCFMLSLWLGYVMVPLPLVVRVRKRILPQGLVWRQIVQNTGQPALA